MTFRRICVAAIAAALLAVPTFASAAKAPTFYRYGSKCTKSACSLAAYTNSKNTSMVAFSLGPKCSAKGSNYSAALNEAPFRIKNGKFSTTIKSNSYDKDTPQGVAGVVTIEGKVTKKDKVKGTWSTDVVSPGCANVKSGSYTMKYKGSQQGG